MVSSSLRSARMGYMMQSRRGDRVLPSAGLTMASDSISHSTDTDSNRISVDSVLEALENLKEVNGSSLNALKKYFTATSPVHLPAIDVNSQIRKALAKGIRDGKIAKFGKSKFSLGFDEDQASPTKKHRRRALTEEDEAKAGRVGRRKRSRQRRSSRSRRRRSKRRRRRRSKKRRGRTSRTKRKMARKGRKGRKRGRRASRKARRGRRRK